MHSAVLLQPGHGKATEEQGPDLEYKAPEVEQVEQEVRREEHA